MTLEESPSRRWILYSFCFVTVSTAAGVVYGWPALRKQLQEDGSNLDESTLGAIFTVGAWSTQGGRFFSGLARDRFGTRSVTSLSVIFVALGSLGVAWSDPSNAIALSFSVFSLGLGSGAQLCVQPVAGLFPNTSGTVLASLSGAFQISGLAFLALTSGGDSVGTRKVRFSGFAIVLVALSVGAMMLLPQGKSFLFEEQNVTNDASSEVEGSSKGTDTKNNVATAATARGGASSSFNDDVELPESSSSSSREAVDDPHTCGRACQTINETEDHASNHSIPSEQVEHQSDTELASTRAESQSHVVATPPSAAKPTALEQIKSTEYILLCIWFSICLIPLQYYIGSIGFQLEDKGDDEGFYTDLFSIVYAGATVFSPAGGYLSDRLSLGFTQGLATIMCAGSFFVLASEISLKGQTVGLVLYGVGRLLVFGMYFANCGKRFGYANFGTLAGLGLLISAVVSLLQYPMISAAANGQSDTMNIASGAALMALTPYFIWLHRREMATTTPEA
jgi:LAT3 family solute carrier family 43 protein 3